MDHSLRYLLLNQMVQIRDFGYEVAGVSSGGSEVNNLKLAGIGHFEVSISREITPLADVISLAKLVQVFRKSQFSVVHTHTPKVGLLGQLAAWLTRVPVIVNTIHGFYFHDQMRPMKARIFKQLEWLAARFSDAVLFQNIEDMHRATADRIVPQAKQHWLGNGIDLSRFNPDKVDAENVSQLRSELRLVDNVPVIGFVGRVVHEKGVMELLSSCRDLLSEGLQFQLLLVGPLNNERGDALTYDAIEKFRLPNNCILTGIREDVPELVSLMDVLALPSYREGFPRAPMEAAAMGVPCVATNIRGCRQAVEDGKTGLLVPTKSVDNLTSALRRLLTDAELRKQMGTEARKKALTEFDERDVFQRVLRVYDQLLTAKGIPISLS